MFSRISFRQVRGRAREHRREMEAIVRTSSDKLRQFLIAYLLVVIYIAAVVLSTTDRQLLLVDEGLKLPLIDLTVTLPGFYFVVPYFVLALHFNLLQNLSNHHLKLMEWQRTWNGFVPTSRINPFIFDFASLGKDTHFFPWVSAVNSFLCLYSAPLLITVLMWRFADYQNSTALWLNLAALWIDLYFVSKARSAFIDNAAGSDGRRERAGALSNIIQFIKSPVTAGPPSHLTALWFFYLFVVVLKVFVCWDVFIRDWEESFIRKHMALAFMQTPDNAREVHDLLWLLPRIAIDKTDKLFEPDIARLKARSELTGKRWDLEFEDRGISLDLRGRSLRYSSLPYQVLPKLRAEKAQLQGANFNYSILNGSVMGGAQLQGAQLDFVELEGTYLNQVNLQGASLAHTRLAGSYLLDAELQGAKLIFAQMQGVFLGGAQLQGADLRGVDLTGAYMDEISTWGAITEDVNVVVLTDGNGAEPTVVNKLPEASDVRRWAATMPYKNDGERYVRWMLEGEADNVHFLSLQADNARTVKEIVELVCGNGKKTLSLIALRSYLVHLVALRHPARDQLVSALESDRCNNKLQGFVLP